MNRGASRVRILARPARSNVRTNPYNALLYDALNAEEFEVQEFALHRCLFQTFDVVHVHWPESTFNHSLFEARWTTGWLLAALRRQRQRGAKVLWTVHNLRAHERKFPQQEELFWQKFTSLLDGFVTLQSSATPDILRRFPQLRDLPCWSVVHPHYRGQYPDQLSRSEARRLLGLEDKQKVFLFFGRILDYKNLPSLLTALTELSSGKGQDYRALIVGRPGNAILSSEIQRATNKDSRIIPVLEFVKHEDVQRYFRASDLVVLPYREILNSGSAILSLSFDRPVLMPQSSCSSELSSLVAAPWIQTYQTLRGKNLVEALDATCALPERTDGEHLKSHCPATAAASLAQAFRELGRS